MYWGGIPACRPREQAKLLQYFLNETRKGSAFAEGMMTLTPCDLWPFIRGRTLWLAGDSITQVVVWDPLISITPWPCTFRLLYS